VAHRTTARLKLQKGVGFRIRGIERGKGSAPGGIFVFSLCGTIRKPREKRKENAKIADHWEKGVPPPSREKRKNDERGKTRKKP